MKNYKLLRLFILFNCIILSGQMFGMRKRDVCTFSVVNHGGTVSQAEYMNVGGDNCASCGSILKCPDCDLKIDQLRIDAKEKAKKSDWKPEGYTFKNNDFKKKTVLKLKIDPDFVAVTLTGIQGMNNFLRLKVKSSSDKKSCLTYVEKLGSLPFSTMQDFFKVDTTEDRLTISVPGEHSEARQNLQQLIEVLKGKNEQVLPKMLFHLLIPRSYKGEINFDLCDSTLLGNVVCEFPLFEATRSVIDISGSSSKDAKFDLNQSTFSGNFHVLKGEAQLKLKNASVVKFYGKKITVSGSVKEGSKTYLTKHIINNAKYDFTSKKYTIDN